jgi:photosystem II stability/assembly factor-like uncharacterized protein
MSMPDSKSSSPPPSNRGAGGRTARDRRWLYLLAALTLIVVSGGYAIFIEKPRPNAYQQVSPFVSLDWWLYPGEENAPSRLPELDGNLNGIWCDDSGRHVWVVGSNRLILHSADGGVHWEHPIPPSFVVPKPKAPAGKKDGSKADLKSGVMNLGVFAQPPTGRPKNDQTTPIESIEQDYALNAVAFLADNRTGCAVGTSGTILRTVDGGTTWQLDLLRVAAGNPLNMHLIAVRLGSAGQTWMVDSRSCLFIDDGGGGIPERPNPVDNNVSAAQVLDDGSACMAIAKEGISTVSATKRGPAVPIHANFTALGMHVLPKSSTCWVVGADSQIFKTTDGVKWDLQGSVPEKIATLRGVWFSDPKLGCAVGEKGTILVTDNGGNDWQAATLGSPPDPDVTLLTVRFSSAKVGWAAGTSGALFGTRDGGHTWLPLYRQKGHLVGTYRWWPAPWYFLSWLPVAFLLVQVLRKPLPTYREEFVDDSLVSDKPLEPGQPDVLGLNDIARGLSAFLRNENTTPPLTVAITGAWGTGKSSLMNLLRADLRRRGFRPVWFNAWHHQKEEHLLASLLANVIRQAVPAWTTPAGLRFRARLLYARLRKKWVTVLVGLFLLGLSIGFFTGPGKSIRNAIDNVADSSSSQEILKAMADKSNHDSLVFGTTGIASLLLLLRGLRRGLEVFGVNAGDLMASMATSARLRDLDAKAGFRADFSRQFKEVTDALQPRTMLVVIDDLDRCRPENVLEVLESVNFLVTSGECFVAIGMDRDQVERCVGLGFEKVAAEMVGPLPGATTQLSPADIAAEAREKRRTYARNYLEKLINFEIPVPRLTAQQHRSLLVANEGAPESDAVPNATAAKSDSRFRREWSEFIVASGRFVRPVMGIALLTIVVLAGYQIGESNSRKEVTTGQQVVPVIPEKPPAVKGEGPSTKSVEQPNPVAFFGSGEPTQTAHLLTVGMVLLAVVVGAIGVFGMQRQPDIITKDSATFTRTLQVWQPLLLERRKTARSIKQFINRLRYYAMRQRALEPERTAWDRFRDWLARRFRTIAPAAPPLPTDGQAESRLVALSIIFDADPTSLTVDNRWQDIAATRMDGTPSDDFLRNVEALKREHERLLNCQWRLTEEDRGRLRLLADGFQTR